MSEELKARLRSVADRRRKGNRFDSIEYEAVDRIEELEREQEKDARFIKELCAQIGELNDKIAEWSVRSDANKGAFAKGFSAGQQALKDTGKLVVIDSPELQELRDAMTKSRAETAAAYERAADVITGRKSEINNFSKTLSGSDKIIFAEGVSLLDVVATAIRAIATPEQSAALDAAKAEARAQGMREAAEIAAEALERAEGQELAGGWTVSTMRLNGLGLSAGEWASECTLETVEAIALEAEKACASAILAAIKGAKA